MQMSAQEKEFLNIDFKGGSTRGEVTLLMLEDHGHHIAYLPTLKLSAYGDTPERSAATNRTPTNLYLSECSGAIMN